MTHTDPGNPPRTPPGVQGPVGTGPRITMTRGWSQLTNAMGHKIPQKLFAAQRARQGMTNLTRGKSRH